jgi:hypothetical protein
VPIDIQYLEAACIHGLRAHPVLIGGVAMLWVPISGTPTTRLPGWMLDQAYLLLREKVIKPLLAGIVRPCRRPPKVSAPLNHHYVALRQELHRTFETIGLAVA